MKNIDYLNLGCGKDIRKDWVNLDLNNGEGVDIVHDLDIFPYPFKDNIFTKINVEAIMEHLNNPKKFIDEIHRISKKDCKTNITVPHFSSWSVWGDITHKRGFNSTSLDCVDIKKRNFSLLEKENIKFKINKIIIFSGIKKIIQPIVNINDITRCVYERNIAYFFSADIIKWDLITIK